MVFSQRKPERLEIIRKNAQAYLEEYNYHKTIEEAQRLMHAAKANDEDYYYYYAHGLLGRAYEDLKDTARARINYSYAVKYSQRTGNDTLVLRALNNLGNSYSNNPETKEEGIRIYEKVIALAEKTHLDQESLAPKLNIAWTYLDHKQYSKAAPFLMESLDMARKKGTGHVQAASLMLMGRYYSQLGQVDSAAHYFSRSMRIAEQEKLLLPAAEVAEDYAELLFKQGKFEEAYQNLVKFQEYKSQIFEKEKLAQIQAANARYDVSEYQKNLELAKKEQLLQDQIISNSQENLLVLTLSSITLVVILLFLYKINRDRKRLILELREKNNQFREAKENAEHLTQLKTEFFSTVSHELRTPLYGVIGLTTLLLEEEDLKKHRKDLNSLKFSADYLLALINDVLQMNKMESKLLFLETVNFELPGLMQRIVKTFEFTRLQNQNKIHLEIGEEVPENLLGDPVRLSQVLMNLVGNAMKFTERGNIYLSARLEALKEGSASIRFVVSDDGIGIPKNKQQLIFEEFSQLNNSNYAYQGTGLGLPIVKRLLELFGSQIHLESEEGKGSEFSFTIEFERGSVLSGETALNGGPKEITRNQIQILIVDDNRINQIVTRRILEKKQFVCEVASDGKQAIIKTRSKNYDLILMDLNMPGLNGLEATMEIRKFNGKVPVVALTAVEIEEIRTKIFSAGMNDIIVKPYDVEQLYQIIYRNLDLEVQEEMVEAEKK